MTVFGMGGGLVMPLVIGAVVVNMFIGAAFGALPHHRGQTRTERKSDRMDGLRKLRLDRSRLGAPIQEPECRVSRRWERGFTS